MFCCKFCEIAQNSFMQNNWERLLLDVQIILGNIIEIRAIILRYKCSEKRFKYLMNFISQII